VLAVQELGSFHPSLAVHVGVLHVGEAISVPPQLDAAGLETWRLRLETALREHTDATDARAEELYRAGRGYRDL